MSLQKAKLCNLRAELGGKRVFSPELVHLHYWEKRLTRRICAWCLYKSRCNKVLGKGVETVPKRSIGGYIFCDVTFRKEGK